MYYIAGGRIADVYGGKKVMAVAMGGLAFLTMIIPVSSSWGGYEGYPWYLIAVRWENCMIELMSFHISFH